MNSALDLAAIPSPSQSVWMLGPVPIRAYALCIVVGIVVACVVTEVRLRRWGAPPYSVLDIAVWAVPFGILGARAYHVITSPDKYFGADGNIGDAFKIWEGGLGIWGAVAGGTFGAWLACRRRGIPLSVVADALAPGMPLAQAVGRLGNWFNNELYGTATTLPWGMKVHEWNAEEMKAYTDANGEPLLKPGTYHPAFLYEALWNVGVAGLVLWAERRFRLGAGRAFALYVAAYCAGRFWIESLRTDAASEFLGMRLNMWTSIVVFLGAVAYLVLVKGGPQRLVVDEDGTMRAVPAGTEAVAPPVAADDSADAGKAEAGKAEDAEPAADPPDEPDEPEEDAGVPAGDTAEDR